MKHLSLLFALCSVLFMVSCGSGTEAGGSDAADETKTEEPSAMTCQELLDKKDELAGQEVTVKGISWGSAGTTTGHVRLNLGDNKLEGMRQATLYANFPEDRAAEAEAVAKDSELTIKGTVGEYAYGALAIDNPTIVK